MLLCVYFDSSAETWFPAASPSRSVFFSLLSLLPLCVINNSYFLFRKLQFSKHMLYLGTDCVCKWCWTVFVGFYFATLNLLLFCSNDSLYYWFFFKFMFPTLLLEHCLLFEPIWFMLILTDSWALYVCMFGFSFLFFSPFDWRELLFFRKAYVLSGVCE